MCRASQVIWLTCQVTSLSGTSRIETGVAGSIVGGGGGSTVHGLQVAHQVLDGSDWVGSVGAATGPVGATTGSANSNFGVGTLFHEKR
jgi:hypothetical protein